MRIAIVGAGVGGLASAILLCREGYSVSLFDQFEKPSPIGSGLMLQPVGLAVLDAMGIGDAARQIGAPISRLLGHSEPKGRLILDTAYGATDGLGIHRAALFEILFNTALAAGPEWHSGKRVAGAAAGCLQFEDRTRSEQFDLIIDASGASSPLSPLRARPLPFGAIWGTVDWVEGVLAPDMLSQRYERAHKMTGILPIGQVPGVDKPKCALFWLLPRDGHADWLSHGLEPWKAEARALWPALAPFLDQITEPDQMTMARYSHGTLSRPIGNGIAFIGDAAHRASPQLGQGANMALLDAFALAGWLSRAPLAEALERYASSRRLHVGVYQKISQVLTPLYQSESRILPFLRDNLLFPISLLPPGPAFLSRVVRGDLVTPIRGMKLTL